MSAAAGAAGAAAGAAGEAVPVPGELPSDSVDVEDLVKRAAAAAAAGGGATGGVDPDDLDIRFSPWQYSDANAEAATAAAAAAATAAGGDGDEIVEGHGDMEADRKGLLKRLRDAMGLDLTRIAIPVYYNEPTSFLHRMCEACQYYDLLNTACDAAHADDPAMRLLYVAAFAVVPYSSAERTTKPFNPILGETFEWTTPDARFVCEQVSHHPPICAGHMETAQWEFEQYKEVKANFTGNAVVAPPYGATFVRTKASGDEYTWGGLTSCVHNILVGRLWVDHYGKFEVRNTVDGRDERATCEFTQCGWFSRGWHQVKVSVRGRSGQPNGGAAVQYVIEGHWNDKLYWRRASEPEAARKLLWQKDKRPAKDAHASFKGFSQHGQELNELTPLRRKTLLASDARLRPDCLALAQLNYGKAGREKWRLEEQQRAERRQREETDDKWTQRWFAPVTADGSDKVVRWRFLKTYWAERERRLAEKGVEDNVTPPTSKF